MDDYCIPWEDSTILESIDLNNTFDASKFYEIMPTNLEYYFSSNGIAENLRIYPALNMKFPLITKENHIKCKCGAYLDTNCQINRENSTWKCHICLSDNQIPPDTMSTFLSNRELTKQNYEIKSFPKNNMSSCQNLVFIIDISFPAIQNGFTTEFVCAIRELINKLPFYYQIAIFTTDDSVTVHTFNSVIKNPNNINKEFFIPIVQGKEKIETILHEIEQYIPPSNDIAGNCIPTAVEKAFELLSIVSGGMILIGFSSLFIYGNYCREPNYFSNIEGSTSKTDSIRDNIKQILRFYVNASVHIFFGSQPQDCDLLTLSLLSQQTHGKTHFYESMNNDYNKRRLHHDLISTVQQPYYSDVSTSLILSPGYISFELASGIPVSQECQCYQIVRPTDYIEFPIYEIGARKEDLKFQIIFLYTKSPDFNISSANENLEEDEIQDLDQNKQTCQVRPRYTRIINGVIHFGNKNDIIHVNPIYNFSTNLIAALILAQQSDLCRAQVQLQKLMDKRRFPSDYYLYHSFLANIVMRKLAIHDVCKCAAALREIESLSRLNLILYLYPRLIVVDEKQPSILSSLSSFINSFLGIRTPIFTDNWEFDTLDLSKMVNRDPLGCSQEVTKNKQLSTYKVLPLTRQSLDEGNVFIIHKHDSVFVYVKSSVSSAFLNNAFNVSKFSDLTHTMPKISKKENQMIWNIYDECCLLSQSKLFFEVLIEGSENSNLILNELFVDDQLVAFADLPTWIAQFKFEQSLISIL